MSFATEFQIQSLFLVTLLLSRSSCVQYRASLLQVMDQEIWSGPLRKQTLPSRYIVETGFHFISIVRFVVVISLVGNATVNLIISLIKKDLH